jgi:hypothetical protein
MAHESGNPTAHQEPAEKRGTEGSDLEPRFRSLARRWKQDTLFCSSTTDMANHPAYREIIAMGWAAVPLILDELRTEPDHWFWALREITGEDPVAPQDRGVLRKMTEAWLRWDAERAR